MASFKVEDATVEDKYVALSQWWQRHCKSFTTWYLTQTSEQQKDIILKAVPDMPTSIHDGNREPLPTDVILPEFSLEGMLTSSGKIFTLFMMRRLVPPDQCMSEDLKLLNDLYQEGVLPSFSNNVLESMDTPFIDPLDPSESIRSLSNTSTQQTRDEVLSHLSTGRLIAAPVWLAMNIRRASIVTLIESLTQAHYDAVEIKPSPTFLALLQGELAQQAALMAATEGGAGGEIDEQAAPQSDRVTLLDDSDTSLKEPENEK